MPLELERNVGGVDRLARGGLGVALAVVALAALVVDRRLLAGVAGLSAAGLLFNATTQFCGLNALLGLDTRPDEE